MIGAYDDLDVSSDPMVSPLLAPDDVLRALPPVSVVVSDVCMDGHVCVCVCTWVCVCMRACVYAYMYVGMCACMHGWVCVVPLLVF